MLGKLTEKMQSLIGKMSGKSRLSHENLADAVREVRLALLEADVNYSVAKAFIQRVKEKVLGDTVLKSVTPGQQFIKIVHDELKTLMGEEESPLNLRKKPSIIMMCGLQGSGKTTQCAKLAHFLLKNDLAKKPLVVACDLARPAAIAQLQTLCQKIDVPVFTKDDVKSSLKVAKRVLKHAHDEGHDVVIVDTAGRLHIDQTLMDELRQLKKIFNPSEIFFVANAATGQDAVNIAAKFNEEIGMTGTILTMLDGSVRGGAAISIREITGKPLKFEGVGERLDDLQPFNPTSMADRILGMGDTINLVRQAKEHIDDSTAKDLEKKIRKAAFTYEDYLKQIQTFRKMGSFKKMLGMLPGMSGLKLEGLDENELFRVESIIQSMTPKERRGECELSVPRRRRIAKGSGRKIDDVNRLVKSFKEAKRFFKGMPSRNKLEKLMGGTPWR